MKIFLLKILDFAFGRASIRVKMILNIIFHQWNFIPSGLYLHYADLQCISEQDVEKTGKDPIEKQRRLYCDKFEDFVLNLIQEPTLSNKSGFFYRAVRKT